MARLLRAVTLGLVLLVLSVTPVLAIATPDTTSIISASIWRHYLETDDMLVMARHQVKYTTWPTTPATAETVTQAVIARFGATGGTDFGSSAPYTYTADNGFGEGVVVIYFTAQEVTDKGITWGSSSYSVKLSGNPSLTWSPTYPSDTTSTLIWKSYSTHDTTARELKSTILSIADELEDAWADTLLTAAAEGMILSTNGETYFTRAFPDLRVAIPGLFSSSITAPVFREETYARTYETTLKGQVPTWVQSGFNAAADLFGVSTGLIDVFFALLIIVGMAVLSWRLNVGAEWGFIAAPLLLVGAARLGLVSLTILGVAALLCVVFLSFVLFLKKAS